MQRPPLWLSTLDPRPSTLQRLLQSVILVLAVAVIGVAVGRDDANAQSWQPEPAAAVAIPPALGPRVVPPPPQVPAAVTHPVAWPGTPVTSGPLGESYVADSQLPTAAANGPAIYPHVPQQTPQPGANLPATYPATNMSSGAYRQGWAEPWSPPAVDHRAMPGQEGVARGALPGAGPANFPLPSAPVQPPAGGPSAAFMERPQAAGPVGQAVPRGPTGYSARAAVESQWDASPAVVAELELCEGAQPLATVGSDWILSGEILGSVNELLKENEDRIPKNQLEEQRKMLIQQKLKQRIETKLIYQDARRVIPKENFPSIEEKLSEYFEEKEFPELMKRAEATSRQDLELKLQVLGTSIDREKRSFMERALAQQWVQEQVKSDEEISHEQMLAYYQEHIREYEYPAQARWEQLMVRVSDYPGKAEAYAAICEMGNQVWKGVPFAEVAKARSAGATASQGGVRDWTSKGSLVSQTLDDALFGLELGKLSQILMDEQGFHIIRVLERKEAGRTPFLEAQVGIREKIREGRRREKIEEYLVRLKEEIPVWTVFDDPHAANPLARSQSNRPN